MKNNYLLIISAFLIIASLSVGNIFLHSNKEMSTLEKRPLQQFPNISAEAYFSGNLTKKIDKFLDDQFFIRGRLLSLNSRFNSFKGLGRQYSITKKTSPQKILNHLIFNYYIIDDFCYVDYTRSPKHEKACAKIMNSFANNNPNLQLHPIIIPTSSAYIPASHTKLTDNPYITINEINAELKGPTPINLKTYFSKLKPQEIFFNTDHHWNGKGTYAAYQAVCTSLGIIPIPLEELERVDIPYFYGTNYSNTMDKTLAKLPDTIITYTPKYPVIMERFSYSDEGLVAWDPVSICVGEQLMGATPSYGVYIGGDRPLTIINTELPEQEEKKVLLVKDSFGNSLATILCNNFSQTHIIDYRYFKDSIGEYARNNGIKDVIFEFSVTSLLYEENLEHFVRVMGQTGEVK